MKYNHRIVALIGYLCFILAALNIALDYHGGVTEGHPFNPGVALGIEAIALLGILAFVISKCLAKMGKTLPPTD